MTRMLVTALFVLAAAVALSLPSPSQTVRASDPPTLDAGCGCPKGTRCCLDCSGHILCVRNIGQCPECPAP